MTSQFQQYPLLFRELDKRTAKKLIIAHHYLHRACPMSWAWGIIVDGKVKGVMTVGKPCSWSVACGVVGETYADMKNPSARTYDVFELNRLWLSDSLPRNTESRFAGWCLRWLRKNRPNTILISYADGSITNARGENHVGYVYQAMNWIYTGTSTAFTDAVSDEQSGATTKVARTPKHRYVWFSNPADQSLLAWPEQPYPKTAA